MQNSVQRNYLLELYPLYSPSYQKIFSSFHFACCLHRVWTALPLPPNLLLGENSVDGERILAHFPHQKNSPHQIAIFMLSLNTSLIYGCWSLLLYHFFNFRLYVQIDHAKFKTKFPTLSPPFNAIGKNLLQLCLFSYLLPPFFISSFINFFWPDSSSCDCIAYELIKYIQFQISENKLDETPYVML